MSCHTDCKYNCGATDCPASYRPFTVYYLDTKTEAIKKVKKQPFFNTIKEIEK